MVTCGTLVKECAIIKVYAILIFFNSQELLLLGFRFKTKPNFKIDQLDWISGILHISTCLFSLFPFSDTTEAALDTLIICDFIMQGTSMFSRRHDTMEAKSKKWGKGKKKSFCKEHSLHMISEGLEKKKKRTWSSLESRAVWKKKAFKCTFVSN